MDSVVLFKFVRQFPSGTINMNRCRGNSQ